jgi:hypothetical protein
MGAWGHKTFEDDTALDLLDEWVNSDDPLPLMEHAIQQALAADYLEYDQGHVIAVAAAIIIHKVQGGDTEFEDDEMVDGVGVWLETLDVARLKAMVPDVIQGLDLLVGDNSELSELWAENEELYPKWRQIHLDMKDRLIN